MTSGPPIRILFLIDDIQTRNAGTEKQLLQLLDRMDRRRFEPHLACLRNAPWLERSELPYPVHVLDANKLAGPDFILAGFRLARLCRRHRIDIVQTFFRDANVLGVPWARLGRVPVVIASRRSLGADYFYRGLHGAVFRWLSPLTSYYLANSRAAGLETQTREGAAPEKIFVIPNALNIREFAPIAEREFQEIRARWGVPRGAFLVGAVANLRPIKNLPFLVDAAAELIANDPGIVFVVLGEGPDRPALEEQILSRGLAGRFFLPGSSGTPARDIQAFDIGVLVSRSESSPNAVLEYMAAGRPTVVADVGGTAELVEEGATGFLYRSEDPESFRARIRELAADPALARRMGAAAREHVARNHAADVVIAQLENLYSALAQGQPAPGSPRTTSASK